MKKSLLLSLSVVFIALTIFFSSVRGTLYVLNEGESIIVNGNTITLSGVSSSTSVVVSVNGVSKACNKDVTYKIGGIDVKVVDIFYYPKENGVSSASLEISESTTIVPCSPCFAYFAFIDYRDGTLQLRNGAAGIVGISVSASPDTTPYVSFDKSAANPGDTITIIGLDTTGDIEVTIYYRMLDTGVAHSDKATIHQSSSTCTDSDDGLNYYVKGQAILSTGANLIDVCPTRSPYKAGITLLEAYCTNESPYVVYQEYECPNGCKDGACIGVVAKIENGASSKLCYVNEQCNFNSIGSAYLQEDDDYTWYSWRFGDEGPTWHVSGLPTANHTYTSGGIYTASLQITDRKYNPGLIDTDDIEVIVTTRTCKPINSECYFNEECCSKTCVRGRTSPIGVCTETYTGETCTDTDNGDYYKKGTVFGLSNVGIDWSITIYQKLEDICSKDTETGLAHSSIVFNDLAEYTCVNYNGRKIFTSETYRCPNGCEDGACLRQTETTTTPEKCWNHAQCSQTCDNIGTEKWQYSKRWQGTCPLNVYGCMTGDCCLGQCDSGKGQCYCDQTNKVDIYGDVCPSGTTCGSDCYCHPSDPTKTKIDITSPKDGQTVYDRITIIAEASSSNGLGDMTLSMQKEGENIGRVIPFTICGGGKACPTGGEGCIYTKSCNYDWDTSGYDGTVLLTATITDSGYNKISDSIKVNVVNYQSCNEQCGLAGQRYGSCKSSCDTGEVDIGIDGCPVVACAPCPAGQQCPICPVSKCCCASKKECPFECCVNDPDYYDKSCLGVTCPICEPGQQCPPCLQPKCIDHRCSWYPEEEFLLKFKDGWNMFSFPVDIRAYLTATGQTATVEITVEKAITGKVVETIAVPEQKNCPSPAHIWHYSNGRYVDVLSQPNSIVNGWGYWVKMDSDCVASIKGNKITINDFPGLTAGWNQIGAPSESVNFFSVIGDCNLVSGPWWFNPASQKFEKAQVLRPGEGYFVKVKDKCKLGTEIPPLPPDELSIVSKALKIR